MARDARWLVECTVAEVGVFKVSKAFYLAKRDLFVFTGVLMEGDAVRGMKVDLCADIGGPGPVYIESVESVKFVDGREEMAITVLFDALGSVPLWEPSTIEGRIVTFTR